MKHIINTISALALAFLFTLGLTGTTVAFAATVPNLGVATGYSVFGNAGITETPARTSHLWGNVGDNGFGHISLIAGQVDGSIDALANVPVANAISSAYGDLAAVSQGATTPLNLAGANTVGPGLYDVAATTLNGPLTLDGAGVYIFRSTSSITVNGAGTMNLINGASACNVFWQIPTSMTISSAAHMEGTIITNTGLISFVSGASLKGRAWASTQVTLDNNQITQPTCVVPIPIPIPVPVPTPTPVVNTNVGGGMGSTHQSPTTVAQANANIANNAGVAQGKVLGAQTSTPGLPNTGLPPQEQGTPNSLATLLGLIALVSLSLVIVSRKRTV